MVYYKKKSDQPEKIKNKSKKKNNVDSETNRHIKPGGEVEQHNRKSRPIMTIYEFTRLMGERVSQLSNGAKPLVIGCSNLTDFEIAKLELYNGTFPIILKRPMPDGTVESWKVNELYINREY